MVYPHQQEVYRALRETAETFYAGAWKSLPIRPRFSRLVVGPSGSGKTHLHRTLARDLDVPLFLLSATDWLPMGCSDRGSRPTWCDIARFIKANERGIIFLDEVDKLASPTPWMTYLRVEMFSLLDFCAPSNLKIVLDEDDEDDPADYARRVLETSAALANRFLVVGGGAFQGLWSASKGSMGFGGTPAQRPQVLHHSQLAGEIPTELANRFASPILSLRPMEAKDYQGMLRIALRKMPSDIRKVIKQRSGNSLQAAVAHGLGCRWIEQLVLEASISGHKRMVRRNKNHVIKDTLTLKTPQPS